MSKNRAAVELGRKGGKSRARSLSPEQRREIASQAAIARWHGHAPPAKTEANALLEVLKAAEPLLKHSCTAPRISATAFAVERYRPFLR
jgi:hypothetical protein